MEGHSQVFRVMKPMPNLRAGEGDFLVVGDGWFFVARVFGEEAADRIDWTLLVGPCEETADFALEWGPGRTRESRGKKEKLGMAPHPERDPALSRLWTTLPGGPDGRVTYRAFLATTGIPDVGAREGDFILELWNGTRPGVPRDARSFLRGTLTQIPRKGFPALAQGLAHLRFLESSWRESPRVALRWLSSYLNRKNVLRGRDDTSPFFVLRPFGTAVSEPIQAESDGAALFELLWQVGCRLPRGGLDE